MDKCAFFDGVAYAPLGGELIKFTMAIKGVFPSMNMIVSSHPWYGREIYLETSRCPFIRVPVPGVPPSIESLSELYGNLISVCVPEARCING